MADEHVPGKECYMKLPESRPVVVPNTMVKLTFNFCEQQQSVSYQSEGPIKPRQAFSRRHVRDGRFLKKF